MAIPHNQQTITHWEITNYQTDRNSISSHWFQK